MIFVELPIIAEKEERFIIHLNPLSIHSITAVDEGHCIVVYGPQGKPLEIELAAEEVLKRINDAVNG